MMTPKAYDAMYKVFNRQFPDVVNVDKPMIIKTMVTQNNKTKQQCYWVRTNVGIIGQPVHRMLLERIGTISADTLSIESQIKAAGGLFQDTCELREVGAAKNICSLIEF